MSVMPNLAELRQASAELDGVELIRVLAGPGGPLRHKTALVSSFGAESVVLLHMAPFTANPGDTIIRKGEPADAAYFISSGEVEVKFGNRRIRLQAGDFVGEMGLLSNQPRSADVVSLDYTKFLKLTRSDFNEILRRYPDIRSQVVELAARRDQMNREPTVVAPGGSEGNDSADAKNV